MDYQKDRTLSDSEVQFFYEELFPHLIGHPIEEAVKRMGAFNAYIDNDHGCTWYEWRAVCKTLTLETRNGRITGREIE